MTIKEEIQDDHIGFSLLKINLDNEIGVNTPITPDVFVNEAWELPANSGNKGIAGGSSFADLLSGSSDQFEPIQIDLWNDVDIPSFIDELMTADPSFWSTPP